MTKMIGIMMVAVILAMGATPAMAGPVLPEVLSEDDAMQLSLQDSVAIDAVGDVSAGMSDDTKTVLAVVGIVFIVLIIAAAI